MDVQRVLIRKRRRSGSLGTVHSVFKSSDWSFPNAMLQISPADVAAETDVPTEVPNAVPQILILLHVNGWGL
jgi:hypothetical protein